MQDLTQHGSCWIGRFMAMASPCELLVETASCELAVTLWQQVQDKALRIECKFSDIYPELYQRGCPALSAEKWHALGHILNPKPAGQLPVPRSVTLAAATCTESRHVKHFGDAARGRL
jgi:hypothetical protein